MTTTMAQTIGTNTAGSLKMENVPIDEDDVEAKGGTVAEKTGFEYMTSLY